VDLGESNANTRKKICARLSFLYDERHQTMSTRRKVCILIGCLLVAAAVGTLIAGCGKSQTPSPDSSAPANTPISTNVSADAATASPRPPETPLPDPYFLLTIHTKTDIDQSAQHDTTDNDVEFKYAHHKISDGIILFIYSMESKKGSHGVTIQDLLLTHDKLVNTDGKEKTVSALNELPQKWQAQLIASFAVGLCKIILNTNQEEVRREMLSQNGMGVIGDENLGLLRLMHGPYHRGVESWESTNNIPTTYAFVLHCPVTSTRMSAMSNEIKTEGSFTNSAVDSPAEGLVFKNVTCNFAGKETFDEMAGEYTSGEAAFDYQFQIFQGGEEIATVKRHVNLTLQQISTRGK
jgi:hypothetical protein